MATNYYVGVQLHPDTTSEVTVQTGNQNGTITAIQIPASWIPQYVVQELTKVPDANVRVLFCESQAEYLRPLLVSLRGRATVADVQLMPKRVTQQGVGFVVQPKSQLDVSRTLTLPVSLGGWRTLSGITADLLTEWWELPSAEFAKVCPLMPALRQLSPAIDASILQTFMRQVVDPRWYATPSDVCGVTEIKRFYGVVGPGDHVFPPSGERGDAFAKAYERAVPAHGRQADVFLKSDPDLLDRKVRVKMLGTLVEYLACAWLSADSTRKSEFFNPKEILNADEYATFTANGKPS